MEIWRGIDGKVLGWRADARKDTGFVHKAWDAFDARLTPEAELWFEQSESANYTTLGLHAFIHISSPNDRLHFKLKWL
jgi:hypothetical protein